MCFQSLGAMVAAKSFSGLHILCNDIINLENIATTQSLVSVSPHLVQILYLIRFNFPSISRNFQVDTQAFITSVRHINGNLTSPWIYPFLFAFTRLSDDQDTPMPICTNLSP